MKCGKCGTALNSTPPNSESLDQIVSADKDGDNWRDYDDIRRGPCCGKEFKPYCLNYIKIYVRSFFSGSMIYYSLSRTSDWGEYYIKTFVAFIFALDIGIAVFSTVYDSCSKACCLDVVQNILCLPLCCCCCPPQGCYHKDTKASVYGLTYCCCGRFVHLVRFTVNRTKIKIFFLVREVIGLLISIAYGGSNPFAAFICVCNFLFGMCFDLWYIAYRHPESLRRMGETYKFKDLEAKMW